MKLLFTGDINFRGARSMTAELSASILSDVLPFAEEVDFVIPNLECPLADATRYAPIKKSGPSLICDAENFCFLQTLHTSAVTLANNHIGDFGAGALRDTLRLLEAHHIAHAGAGENLDEAYQAIHLEKDGVKLSILSVCENEFGIATNDAPGSAGYQPRRMLRQITAEKQDADFVIVVFHGGNEYNPLPSPDTVERYRLLCDMGADAVVAGHTHCPQGYELYQGKPIFYSMGNFYFPSDSGLPASHPWYYGYLTMLDVQKSGVDVSVIPYHYQQEHQKIEVFTGSDREVMLNYIQKLSGIIQNEALLKQYFKGWAWNHPWCPSLPADKHNLAEYRSAPNVNLLRCEAHLSVVKQLLETFFLEETAEAEKMEKEILALQVMPV